MNFQDLLAQYPRIAIAGAPRTGKTSLTNQVSDRPVIHTDDWMERPWEDVPALVAAACAGLEAFVLEGVRAPDALRKGGVEVDAVVWLSKPKVEQTPVQRSMGIGVHTVLAQWKETHPDVPIVTEAQLTMPTLDHADLPRKTRRYAAWTLDASQIERTPQGGLRIPARVSKAGVFKYQRGQRVLREYRPASELRKPECLATFKGAPIVVLHPQVNGGAVDTDNAKQLTVGHFEDPFFNEETQAIEGIVVTNDATTIERIESGELADISSAYDNGRDFNPGFTPEGEPFDLTQTDYVCNHIALGPPGWGRQGQDVGLLTLDADDNQVAAMPPSTSEEDMVVKTDDKNADKTKTADAAEGSAAATTKDEGLSPEDIVAFKKVCAMLPELTKLLNAGKTDAEPPAAPAATTAEGGGLPGMPKPEDEEEKKTLDANDIERIAQEGVEVRTEAMAVLGKDYSPKGKSTRQVRVDVIRTFDSKFSADGKSDEAISSAYGIALKAGAERSKNAEELARTRKHGTRTMDEGDAPPRKPIGHQAYEAWRDPPAAKN
jgi:hypothetical protein